MILFLKIRQKFEGGVLCCCLNVIIFYFNDTENLQKLMRVLDGTDIGVNVVKSGQGNQREMPLSSHMPWPLCCIFPAWCLSWDSELYWINSWSFYSYSSGGMTNKHENRRIVILPLLLLKSGSSSFYPSSVTVQAGLCQTPLVI